MSSYDIVFSLKISLLTFISIPSILMVASKESKFITSFEL